MKYRITQKVIDLVQALYDEGYAGEVNITPCMYSGAKETLGDSLCVVLQGFSKEVLHIVENEAGNILLVGRYSPEGEAENFEVRHIVSIAWGYYKHYSVRGYSRPDVFEELFKKYGYIEEKVVTQIVEKD